MKLARLALRIDLSDGSWVELTETMSELRTLSAYADLDENFDHSKLNEAMDILKEAIIQ